MAKFRRSKCFNLCYLRLLQIGNPLGEILKTPFFLKAISTFLIAGAAVAQQSDQASEAPHAGFQLDPAAFGAFSTDCDGILSAPKEDYAKGWRWTDLLRFADFCMASRTLEKTAGRPLLEFNDAYRRLDQAAALWTLPWAVEDHRSEYDAITVLKEADLSACINQGEACSFETEWSRASIHWLFEADLGGKQLLAAHMQEALKQGSGRYSYVLFLTSSDRGDKITLAPDWGDDGCEDLDTCTAIILDRL